MDMHTLYLAVLLQVVTDIRCQRQKCDSQKNKRDALYWFKYKRHEFNYICLLANVEPGKTRIAMQSLINMSTKEFQNHTAIGYIRTYNRKNYRTQVRKNGKN